MKKAIFLGLMSGLVFLVVGFWLGTKANTPEVEVSIAIEETPQLQEKTSSKGKLPKSNQKSSQFLTQTKEEEPKAERTEVVESQRDPVQEKLAKLGLSLNQKFEVKK